MPSAAKEIRSVSERLPHEGKASSDAPDSGIGLVSAEHDEDASAALELGQRIREVRRKKSMTLREAAEAAGVSESFLSQVERGLANPSVASLRRIADAMHEPVASFFVGEAPTGMLVRVKDRRRLVHPMGMLEDYLLTPPTARKDPARSGTRTWPRRSASWCSAGTSRSPWPTRHTP
jgi:transcriptional regulator with XRE-family HTH domain